MHHSDSIESLTPTLNLLDLLSNTEQYPLSYDQTVGLMEKAVGEKDIISLLHKFTADVDGVYSLLYELYPLMEIRV